MLSENTIFKKRDFWLKEKLRWSEPHFRLKKCARIVNALSRGRNCDLLDVGCGPATLALLLEKNINYFGIDLAIPVPAPNLLEMDITANEIKFGTKVFDIVVMQGIFEYLGAFQCAKFAEVQRILKRDGRFVVSYLNFNHVRPVGEDKLTIYNNIQPVEDFKRDLESFLCIDKWFATSHNWYRSEPRREWLRKIQMPLEIRIPKLSRWLAVEYFFICSLRR